MTQDDWTWAQPNDPIINQVVKAIQNKTIQNENWNQT